MAIILPRENPEPPQSFSGTDPDAQRRRVLDGENVQGVILRMIDQTAENLLMARASPLRPAEEWQREELFRDLVRVFSTPPDDEKKSARKRRSGSGIAVALAARDHMDLRRAALPHMQALRDLSQETVSLTVLDGRSVLYIEALESPQPVKIVARPGRRLPVHCTATGKVFLAHLPPTASDAIIAEGLPARTQATITDPQALRHELTLTRERGFGLAEQECEVGISAVAAPVWGREGEVVAALAVSAPSYRLSRQQALALAPAVCRAAEAISRQLGAGE